MAYEGRKHNHPLYWRWNEMKKRCGRIDHKDYKNYGGKGVTVCDRWKDFDTFVQDMGLPPSPKHSIDRIDGSKGYSKENCRWATWKEQTQNRWTRYKCKRGHLLTEENTCLVYVRGIFKTKRCRICLNKNQADAIARKKLRQSNPPTRSE